LWCLYDNLPRPDFELYDLSFPYDFLILIPQFLALGGIIWTLKYFSGSEFLGLTQIKRWIASRSNSGGSSFENFASPSVPEANAPDEKLTLRIEGPYKVVRHPLYLFTILFLMLRPTMDLFYLVFLIFLIVYFYIGSFYEERKLVSLFGDQYRKYQSSVPRLFGLRVKTFY
jgi:steroid 5-alpha reductase family enzyme